MESGREVVLQAPSHSVGVPGEFRERRDTTRRQSMLSGRMKSRTPTVMLHLHLPIHSFGTCVLNTCTVSGARVGIQNKAQSKIYCPQDAVAVVEGYKNKLIDNHKIYRILNKEYYETKSKAEDSIRRDHSKYGVCHTSNISLTQSLKSFYFVTGC